MDTAGRLIAGSHNRNEFVLINADETARVRSRLLNALVLGHIGLCYEFSDFAASLISV